MEKIKTLFKKSKKVIKEEDISVFFLKTFLFVENRFKNKFIFPQAKYFLLYIIKQSKKFTSDNIDDVLDFCFNRFLGLICPQQIRDEFKELCEIFKEKSPGVVLEIGTADGGTLFCFSKLAPADATIISIDLPGKFGGYPGWKIPLYKSFGKSNQKMFLLKQDLHTEETLRAVKDILNGRSVDFLFIDGDHSYKGVKKDFEMYSPLVKKGGIIAFHDVVIHPKESGCFVRDFWMEIKNQHSHKEIIENQKQEGGGIGILFF